MWAHFAARDRNRRGANAYDRRNQHFGRLFHHGRYDLGTDASGFDPDGQLPPIPESNASKTSRQRLVDVVVGRASYTPDAIVAVADPSDESAKAIALFEGRLDVTTPTAFVCQRFVCRLPVTTPKELTSELAATIGS